MSLKVEASAAAFQTKLKSLEDAVKSHKLINTNLEIVEKKGFRWKLLCLLRPFCILFGYDVYTHVRINKVANAIFDYCEKNKKWVDKSTIASLNSNVISKLSSKSTKHESELKDLFSDLCELLSHNFKDCIWPTNINELNLTNEQKADLDSIFGEIVTLLSSNENTYSLTKEKVPGKNSVRKLFIKKGDEVVKEYTLPITIDFIKKDKLTHIVLIGKKILSKGGSRGNVRLCYDLTDGLPLVRKKSEDPVIEGFFVNNFTRLNHIDLLYPGLFFTTGYSKRGIVEFFGERKSLDDPNKSQLIEYRYQETLSSKIDKKDLDIATKKSFIQDLLCGLNTIHEIRMRLSYKDSTTSVVNGFHHDLKPDNIVIRTNPTTNKLEASITDFGLACKETAIGGTPGFRSPETIAFLYNYRTDSNSLSASEEQIIDFNRIYGQMQDIWPMGLVLIALLTEPTSETSPIPCISTCLVNSTKATDAWKKKNIDAEVMDLKQTELDKDLITLRDNSLGSVQGNDAVQLRRLWDEIIFKMMRIKPEERLSAKAALQAFRGITAT
jgi:serine/threonine protein kinase